MFTISDHRSVRHCEGWTRRQFLRVGSLGAAGLTLPGLLATQAHANPQTRHFYRDKAVVLLFLQGGPPQIETFDPKPGAPHDVRSVTGAIGTKLPGVAFGATFPRLSSMADKIAIVRSFASGDGGHNQLPVLTGNSESGGTMASQFSRLVGANHPKTAIPTNACIVPEAIQPDLKLGQPTGPFTLQYVQKNYVTPGRLGNQYKGLMLDGGDGLLSNLELSMPRKHFDDRRRLLRQLDHYKRRFDTTGELEGINAFQQQAFDVLQRGITDAFDLSKEDPRTIAEYDTGRLVKMRDYHKGGARYNGLRNQSRITNLLGKQMLLARRLCEAGCGFVTVVDSCWDFHADGNNPGCDVGMNALGWQLDHAIAAFLNDLERRGLSDKIMLVVTGEMGRSPKKNRKAGTGHWSRLTPLLVAGGGLKMGQVIGETDRSGGEPASQQYLPQHLRATIMQTLFDPTEARLVSGLPETAKAITDDEPIRELF